MSYYKFILIATIAIFTTNCKKDTKCAMLYYTPMCASIKGYVIFDDTKEGRVFLKDIDPKFRKDSVHVCIKYTELGNTPLSTDCYTYEAIEITSIE